MKTFKCSWQNKRGDYVYEDGEKKIKANSSEEAARIYEEKHPSSHPRIIVGRGFSEPEFFDSKAVLDAKSAARDAESAARDAESAARLESLQKLHSSVESADGNLAGLSYIELSALVENLRDFPVMRDKISPEECAVREELYKAAFFDRNLQAGLQAEQAELQVELLRDLKSAFTGQQSEKSGSGAGKSNLARNVGMMGGIAALQKLNQIEDNTGDVSEGLGFD